MVEWRGLKPGDIANEHGDILSTLTPKPTLILWGVVMVTKEQADKAEGWGWAINRTYRDGHVDIVRQPRVKPVGPERRRQLDS